MFATSAMTQAVNPAIYDKLPYDPVEDFEAITRMGTSPFVLLVDRNSPINSAAELTAKLKAEPGKHNYGAGALPARVASELYKMAAGVEAVYVGYKSNPQAIPDVQSGLLTFMMIDTVNAKIAIDRGALKGLFVTDTERYAPLPDLPTAAEAGLPEVLLTTWTGYYAPKGTPREIVHKINADIRKVAALPRGHGAARRVWAASPGLMSSRGIRRLHALGKGALGQDHPTCQYQGGVGDSHGRIAARQQGPPLSATVADESAPYETITVDKLTPIIGAEIGGIDLSKPLSQPPAGRGPPRARRELRDLLPRPAHHARPARRLRPPVRRPARPSRRAA